jgi:hypothetical protein
MKAKILRGIQASMLLVGVCALSGCFGSGPYYGGGPGYAPGYAYAPEYVAPYRGGPVYYPPSIKPDSGYYVPGRGPVHYYNGGEHAWEPAHQAPGPEVRPEQRDEHH